MPGVYARMRVPVITRPALLVPAGCCGYDQRGSFVLVVNQVNVVERRAVKTGPLVDQLRVIDEGLRPRNGS